MFKVALRLAASLVLTVLLFVSEVYGQVHVWQRWEQSLTSSRNYENPYADITVEVTYSGPDGRTIKTQGFWDGGATFKIRCAFPVAGTWSWGTNCSDTSNRGLHNANGRVTVASYAGDNPLYRHGFLKISSDRHYLAFNDGTPFLWMGDTCWAAPIRATQAEWQAYVTNRVNKHFTLIQLGQAEEWMGSADREGNTPFTGSGITQWNPAFWQGYEQKVEYANKQGIVILAVGLMEPLSRYPSSPDAQLFAKNFVARMFGNFVIFSPSFDSPNMTLADDVGNAIDSVTSVHLITQHPGTPYHPETNTFAEAYYDRDYLDFSSNQTGHNAGDKKWCYWKAVNWNLSLQSRKPDKPVMNIEAFYANQVEELGTCTDLDARALGYLSWLSGSPGYTYGEECYSWKCADCVDWAERYDDASASQMGYMHDLFDSIAWWTLRPAHNLVQNQSSQDQTRIALAKSVDGRLAVAYLPDNNSIQIAMGEFPTPMTGKWFDPRNGQYTNIGDIANSGTYTLDRPGAGDWVLLLSSASKISPP